MATILESALNLIKKALDDTPPLPPLPTKLQGLSGQLGDLTALSVDVSGDGIDRWLDKLAEITGDTELHDTLVVRVIQVTMPRVAELLILSDIVTVRWDPAILLPDRPVAFSINWTQFNDLISNPGPTGLTTLFSTVNKLKDVKALQALILVGVVSPQLLLRELEYHKQGFSALPLPGEPGVNLGELIDEIQSPLRVPLPLPSVPQTIADFKDVAGPTAAGPNGWISLDGPTGGGLEDPLAHELDKFAIELHLNQADLFAAREIDLGGNWRAVLRAAGSGAQSYRLEFNASGINPAIRPGGDLAMEISRKPGANGAVLVGDIDGTNLKIDAIGAGVRLRSTGPMFDFTLSAGEITLTLKPEFLRFLSFGLPLPDALILKSSVDIGYEQGKGLIWKGDSADLPGFSLRQVIPLDFKIGSDAAGAKLDHVTATLRFAVGASGLQFRVEQRYDAKGQFGPLSAIMDGAGFSFGRGGTGAFGLIAPNGIGLALKAGPVDGGGFLKIVSANEFAGALQLKILGIGAFAYGLYQTLPGGALSFAALIGIRLPLPGIQISFGFAVSGFGGLVGINRRADTDLLRERLASGAAGDVLFNDNPMANAPALLGNMRQFFPAEDGIFIIGPTLQINWLYILKLDVGVFIELPGPRKIFIAGSARLVIGSEEFALVYLRMDFIGGIDFTKSLIFFDASLVNSQVLGIFKVTGGVALRIAYGQGGYFLFSVGGFHPSFNPAAMEVPRVARVGVSFDIGPVWLKQEMYLALTSNTFQLGAKVEAGIDLDVIAAHGWFGFDALVQFKPFYFVATVDAGFDVEVLGVSLCSVRVHGQLSGPGPLTLHAEASVKILFVRVSGSITIELSDNPAEIVVPIPNIPAHLKKELESPDNLRIEGKDDSVQIRPTDPSLRLFTPVGTIVWEQKRTPLKLPIAKLEGVDLGGNHNLKVESDHPADDQDERDWFGVGTYLKLADAEALNTSRFAEQASGIRIGEGAPLTGNTKAKTIELNVIKLPKRILLGANLDIAMFMNGGLVDVLADRSAGSRIPPQEGQVTVNQEQWKVVDASGAPATGADLNEIQAFVSARSMGGTALPATESSLKLAGVI